MINVDKILKQIGDLSTITSSSIYVVDAEDATVYKLFYHKKECIRRLGGISAHMYFVTNRSPEDIPEAKKLVYQGRKVDLVQGAYLLAQRKLRARQPIKEDAECELVVEDSAVFSGTLQECKTKKQEEFPSAKIKVKNVRTSN